MQFTAHNRPRITSKPIPRRPRNSAAAWLWEAAIMAIAAVGAVAFLVVGLQRYERGADLGTPSASAAIEPAIFTPPNPFDGLPDTPEAIERAKAEAEAAFRAAWAPRTVPTTRGTAALSEPNYIKRRHRDHGHRDGLEYPRDGRRDHEARR